MYEALFGNQVAEKCLLYIANYGEGHIRGIARTFGFSPGQVKPQLEKLERGGVLVSRLIGNVRSFTVNPRLGIKNELAALLEKMLAITDSDAIQLYYRQRRRPVYSTQRRCKRSFILERDKGVCALCGAHGVEWEADHTIPICEGGLDSISNIRTLCVPCHKQQTKDLQARLRSYT